MGAPRRRGRGWATLAAAGLFVAAGIALAPALSRLDWASLPSRAAWQLPDRVVEALALAPGARVADIGAGDGYFTFRLADAVGPEGVVFAVDVDETALGALRAQVQSRGASNVVVVPSDADDPALPDAGVDLAFLCNVYHHIDERVGYFAGLRSDLAPGGRVAIVEVGGGLPGRWLTPRGHWTAAEALVREMRGAGYELGARFDFLPFQDFVIFHPAP